MTDFIFIIVIVLIIFIQWCFLTAFIFKIRDLESENKKLKQDNNRMLKRYLRENLKVNRAQRRRVIKKIPQYRKVLKDSTQKSMDELEQALKKKWEEDDDSLNYGEINYEEDNDDEFY